MDSLFLCDSLSKLQYHALLLVMMWGDKMPTWWEEVRWMTQALWRHTRLMLTFWWYIRRRIISFRWSWIIEPWWCWCLDVRNRWYGRLEILGRLEQDCMRFHPVTQNSSQFLNLWIVYSWNFPFNILRPEVTETAKSKTSDEGELLLPFTVFNAQKIKNIHTYIHTHIHYLSNFF